MSKTILITGAATGFGKGVAFGLAKQGHNIIATVENWPQKSLLMAEAAAANISLTVEKFNYLEEDDLTNIVNKYGNQVDIVHLNAATGETGPVAEVPVKRIKRVFEVNVFKTIEIAQQFAKIFVEKKKGKIIFTSSIAGFVTFPFLGPYVASKHALEGLVQSMQQEMENTGVTIVTINPGPYRTGFNDRMYDTVDQWYDASSNFTEEQPIREVQQLFAGDKLQLDPQEMIDYMIEKIPLDKHNFRNVCPESAIEDVKKYQNSLWDKQVG